MEKQATFRLWRGDVSGGAFQDYTIAVDEGMVVIDAVHLIQGTKAHDLAVRWNCKAGKCGSCSAEINGVPGLMCMTRLIDLPLDRPVVVAVADIPYYQGFDDRRVVELRDKKGNQGLFAEKRPRRGKNLACQAKRRRPGAGIP